MKRKLMVLLIATLMLLPVCLADSIGDVRVLGIPYTVENTLVSSSGYYVLYALNGAVISSQNLKHDSEMAFEDYVAEKYPTYTAFEVFKTIELDEISVDCAKVDFTFNEETFTILAAYATDDASDYLMLIDCAEEIRPEFEASLDEIDLVSAPSAK